jgi:hypothetical protein
MSDSNNLRPMPNIKPRLDIVDMLERVIEQIKTGEIRGAAIAYTFNDGCTGGIYVCDEWPALMLGSIDILHRRVEDGHIVNSEEQGT